MGKHKNSVQNSIIVEFMENNPDIAKGYTKRDKALVNALWQELSNSLNSAGPPQKDANGWKKAWTEWKSEIRKILSHNKNEARATGGGPFTKHQLTQLEESIVRICGIERSVYGVTGVAIGHVEPSDDLIEEVLDETNSDIPSTSSKRQMEPSSIGSTPKRPRVESTAESLKNFLKEDNELKMEMNEKLDELIKIGNENAKSFTHIHRAVEDMVECCTQILTVMEEKNQIEKQRLDLSIKKFDFQRQLNGYN
ncbi:uncharacterized protein LOC118734818 [Rhagoletis pomonella]|uniref:uncharacterized protein LOC118734818 n=1 Tax=Rhagoletis pomonella TaxID=28610 RepID=UPI001781CA12|nr:uncharacterized protein LOC118734818 [Rhagoletis pomonella]